MNRKIIALFLALALACILLTGCGNTQDGAPAAAPAETGEPFAVVDNDRDFSALRTPGSQEEAYGYKIFFRPGIDGIRPADPSPFWACSVLSAVFLVHSPSFQRI